MVIEEFLKDKKRAGIFAVIALVITASGILYWSSGYKELKKNDTESIFVDDETGSVNNVADDKYEKNSSDYSKVNKSTTAEKNITVEIKGEVKKPDVYVLKDNSIIKDLIEEAGGLTENADISSINRAEKLQDHELIYIADKNGENTISAEKNPAQSCTSSKQSSQMININSATAEELKSLNGIGDSKAGSIIEYREKIGGFKSIDDIKNVDGIGEKMFEKIKDRLTV